MSEQIDYARLGREVAAYVLDALNRTDFGEQLAEKVADKVSDNVRLDFTPYSGQGWGQEFIHPAWSEYCLQGEHDSCDGTAPPSERGCHCVHHRGEPWPQYGYRLRLVELTEAEYRAEGGELRG
jgi:hypothetical protein